MEGKQKRRLNFFDVIIVVVLLAVVAAALLLRYGVLGGGIRDTEPIRYTVEFAKINQGTLDQLEIGQTLYDSVDGEKLGTLVDFRAEPQEELWYSQPLQKFFFYDSDEYSDLYLTVEADGYVTGQAVQAGPTVARVGEAVAVKAPGYAAAGYIVDVDTLGKEVPEDTAGANGNTTVTYQVQFTDMRDFVADTIHVGDKFYDEDEKLVGQVTAVEITERTETMADENGEPLKVAKPERYDAIVTMEGRCNARDDGYYLDGSVELKLGTELIVHSPYLIRSFTFYDILSVEPD